MAKFVSDFFKIAVVAVLTPVFLVGAQSPNMRGSAKNNARNENTEDSIGYGASVGVRQDRAMTTRSANTQGVKARSARSAVNNDVKTRSAVKKTSARPEIVSSKSSSNVAARSGVARATAIFSDTSKIGGGYSECRDAYATCMDQFCAVANDTYRRCFCSDRFMGFRETSEKLDSALQMLADFQNVNLEMVDKSAAEVNAMYTATDGEKAIKRDSGAAQKLLNSINGLLSGKTSLSTKKTNSLGVLDFSGFNDDTDIWNSGDVFSFFGSDNSNLADLEGKALYDKVSKQCADITRETCGSDAMFNLARSSYSVMINQDCNIYEKNLNAKRLSLEDTVRTAEKYLRDARLEEYRAHNSADVNECLAKVESAIRQPAVCGADYERCMDYTGKYISVATGEPIYSTALFELNKLITLDGSSDVLSANPNFSKELDKKREYASSALNTCRDVADTVWNEFKRAAIIQIAQAQDEKLQQAKDSCVTAIKACYDTQEGTLKEMDVTKAKATNAIATTAARSMCYDKVMACAALYGDPNGCKYDDSTKKLVTNTNCKRNDGKDCKCGLQALLTFVDTVDSVKVAEGCEQALTKYAHELCDDDIGTTNAVVYGKCARGELSKTQLRAAMELHRKTFCVNDLINSDGSNSLQENDAFNTNIMNQVIKDIYDAIKIAFTSGCEDEGGEWKFATELQNPDALMLKQEFYKKYYGTTITNMSQINDLNLAENGWCIQKQKEWTDSDYGTACSLLGGVMNQGMCEIKNSGGNSGGTNQSSNTSSTSSGGGNTNVGGKSYDSGYVGTYDKVTTKYDYNMDDNLFTY